VLAALVVSLASVGRMLVAVDPLAPVDAIYVLAGSSISRALEAADLYHAGFAPAIVMSPGSVETAERLLEARGIHVATSVEIAREVLVGRLAIPPDAITVLPGEVDNTAQEAEAIGPSIASHHWTRLIVITDCSSTRRAGYAFRRALGAHVTIVTRCARTDPFQANRWWMARWSIRETFYETPKLLAYWLGLRG
jgi:uncharacterized SAM-binding protein YcdF (DUF218 family)